MGGVVQLTGRTHLSRLYFKLPANDFFPITCLRITLRVNLEFSLSWEHSIFFFQK
jgi:hypothetical protein